MNNRDDLPLILLTLTLTLILLQLHSINLLRRTLDR